jgi:hypothetical protein
VALCFFSLRRVQEKAIRARVHRMEPICRETAIAPLSYYAHVVGPG